LLGEVYATTNNNNVNVKNYNFDDEVNDSLGWGKKFIVASLVNIARTSLIDGEIFDFI
jgi:hypothetical protein